MEEPRAEELDRAVGPGDVSADIIRKISSLTVAQKIRLLNTTNKKKVRAILVKDSNQRIGIAVVNSSNVTIEEIQEFARMKDLHSDVLTAIAEQRRYIGDRIVAWNLLNNPKMPVTRSQRLLGRFSFTWKELMTVAKNRDLPQALRNMALRRSQAKPH